MVEEELGDVFHKEVHVYGHLGQNQKANQLVRCGFHKLV
jgi:hypothetical protein